MDNQLEIFQNDRFKHNFPKEAKLISWPVIGHETQIDYLKSNILTKDLAHAYLFAGEEKIGKKRIALFFIKSLLCEASFKFCNKCVSCMQVDKGMHPDVLMLSGTEPIKIEEVRGLIARINLKPFNSFYKIALIDNAERMTLEAGNALLKTLEEPVGPTVIILISKSVLSLLETVVSRTRVVKFFKVSDRKIEKLLENQKVNQKKKNLLFKISMGKPGRVFELLDNPKGFSSLEEHFNDFLQVLSSDKFNGLNYASRIAKLYESEPGDVLEIINFWILVLMDIIKVKNISGYKSFVTDYFPDTVLKKLNTEVIFYTVNYINTMRELLTRTGAGFNSKLIFDLMILQLNKLGV